MSEPEDPSSLGVPEVPPPSVDDVVIDLGNWPGLNEFPIKEKVRPVEHTRANLAYCLVGILAVVVVALLVLLAFERIPAEAFAEIAGLLISPLVGLVGAVTGYYYGRGDRR